MSAAQTHVALLGGSFDPPHLGHMALAQASLQENRADAVWWLVAGQPWQKPGLRTAGKDRLAMVKRAVRGRAGMHVCDIELHRSGPTYTLNTVEQLSERYPHCRWSLLIGEDQWRQLDTWHGIEALRQKVGFIVGVRGTNSRSGAAQWLEWPGREISSTEIRRRAALGGDIGGMVSPAVARYIAEHRLYASPAES